MNIDISCISETWFDADYGVFSTVIKEAGHKMCHAFRMNKSGSGVAIAELTLRLLNSVDRLSDDVRS